MSFNLFIPGMDAYIINVLSSSQRHAGSYHLRNATFPKPGCNACYSSCAVCPTRSWKDRKTDLENYFMYVIGDYGAACAWRWARGAATGHE
ncbi:hypothetical protein EYF80_023948 [Liparis tanakae]|uniref:Uncharacterized protein n=1 Tax=Liparis tanakae TaxID=230148 RepID=A0A4Z2HJ11_9TELE|nr:hypothetical protein EYF80_023948 [Liparis tanakae]